mmetsp:Transcript_2441/g.6514  ORF Transcript_2441/g.6514 Transcript_2441/m.6514 type:complete len:82 (-) Transcript_2441:243-488(-)
MNYLRSILRTLREKEYDILVLVASAQQPPIDFGIHRRYRVDAVGVNINRQSPLCTIVFFLRLMHKAKAILGNHRLLVSRNV